MPHCTAPIPLQLLAQQQQLFVTRVPVTLNEAKQAVATIGCTTADRSGQWLSWPLATRELCRGRATLVAGAQRTGQPPRAADIGQNLLKDSTRELKAFAKLCARRFACEADAQAELSCFTASLMLLQLDAEVVGEPVYTGRGRPKRGEEPIGHQFQITGLAATSLACVEGPATRPGCSSWRPMTTAIR